MDNTILDNDEIVNENDYRDFLAPKWKRFFNLIIDFYLIYFGSLIGATVLAASLQEVSTTVKLLILIGPYLTVFFLYFFTELYYNKTLGKLITGTKVISVYDDKLSTKQLLIRTLSRIIPFEPFSILFGYTAWHDDWSDTAVVNNSYHKE